MADALMRDYVYLDWAATAPLCEDAATAMQPYFIPGEDNIWIGANANSLHGPGRAAFSALEQARRSLAQSIGARRPTEMIFTSGSTEANNTALKGIVQAVLAQPPFTGSHAPKPLIITSALEHDAVLEPLRSLAHDGIELIELAPSKQGFIEPEALEEALRCSGNMQPVLVSIQAANGEIGVIQPLAQLAKVAKRAGAYFHTDATQILGKAPFHCESIGIDAASFSAHKIGGPKGVGALYLRTRVPFRAQLLGGGQEEGRRSTTQNVAGAVGFAAACQVVVQKQEEETARERALRDDLYEQLMRISTVQAPLLPPRGSIDHLPHIVTVMVEGFESETLILRLDEVGFGVSGGSACSSRSLEASHVLRALGVNSDLAQGELRISFGSSTTSEDLTQFVQALTDCLNCH